MTSYAIPSELFNLYNDIDSSLRGVDRFRLPEHLEARLASYIDFKLTSGVITLTPGHSLYRARIFAFNQSEAHSADELGAPPPSKARAGRLNPEGLPVLYVANNAMTALSETRPWVGAKVSVATFRPTRVLRMISLSIGIDGLLPRTANAQHPGFLAALNMDLNHISRPAHPDDRLSYLPTQYIASRIRAHAIDGLAYSSALREGGMNYAVFEPSTCSYSSASKFEVKSVEISAQSVA